MMGSHLYEALKDLNCDVLPTFFKSTLDPRETITQEMEMLDVLDYQRVKKVLGKALAYCTMSDFYDITILPLMNIWGFDSNDFVIPNQSEINKTFSQLLPPFKLLNTPLSELGSNGCPIAATKTIFGLLGCISTAPIRPEFCKPTFFHVLPASFDLYTPLPTITFDRIPSEPVPTSSTFGSC